MFVFIPTALNYIGLTEDFGCYIDCPYQQKSQRYVEQTDNDGSPRHILYGNTSGKLKFLYSITNAICSPELNNFRVEFKEPVDSSILVTFTSAWRNESFIYRECPANHNAHRTQFDVKCALGCASDFIIFLDWVPSNLQRSVILRDVEILTPPRLVEPDDFAKLIETAWCIYASWSNQHWLR